MSAEKAAAPLMPIPNFADIGKAANDLVNRDFYHASAANFEGKFKAPNGANVTVKSKHAFDGAIASSVEGKLAAAKGITTTVAYNNASLLDVKAELTDLAAPGVKIDLQQLYNPAKDGSAVQKINLAFKNPNVHSRAFITHAAASGKIDAVVDLAVGHEGFLLGGEAGYDVQKAAVTKYSLALGYQAPTYSANITALQNLNIVAATFYQKVNSSTEVGIKTGYDVSAQKASGLEAAAKYKLDPLSFAKAKLNDRGILALAYNTKLNTAVTAGLGLSLDTTKLNEAGHKLGFNFVYEG